MGIAAHIARLRAVVGHELLVRPAGHDDGWNILGGAVDPGESPAAAAVREAGETAWFAPGELHGLQLSRFARALLEATGRI